MGEWWILPLLCFGMMALCFVARGRASCCRMGRGGSHGNSAKRED